MPRAKETFEAMRQATKQKINIAALSLFSRKGLSVTVGEIAKSAGISQGLLYSHYTSKDALIAELVRIAISTSGRSIAEFAESDGSADGKVRQITSMMCRMFLDIRIGIEYFMFMVQVQISGFPVPEESWYSEQCPDPIESFAKILARGQADGSVAEGDPLRLATVYWAAFQGLCCYAGAGVTVEPDERAINRIVLREEYL